jgi:hypothetical protein
MSGYNPLCFRPRLLHLACFVWVPLLLFGCGPTLTEQKQLAALSHSLLVRCQTSRDCQKTEVRRCVEACKHAVDAIQKAQEARSAGLPDSDLSVTAAGLTSVARSICEPLAWMH